MKIWLFYNKYDEEKSARRQIIFATLNICKRQQINNTQQL